MKRLLLALAASTLLATSAEAAKIGVSMALFDDNFLTVLRNGMQDYAKTQPGVTLQVEDAQNDVGKQLNQIQNFIAAEGRRDHRQPGRHRRDAGDDQARRPTPASRSSMSTACRPTTTLPSKVVLRRLGRDSSPARWRRKEVCKLLGGKGNIVVMMGELSNQAARQRTQDVARRHRHARVHGHRRSSTEQTGNWERTQGTDLMTNWISRRPAVRRRRLQQ